MVSVDPLQICDIPQPEWIIRLWPKVRPHLKRALDREGSGRFLPVDVLELLLASKARLWIVFNQNGDIIAAAVTDIQQSPRYKELYVWLVGGTRLREWIFKLRDMLEAFARDNGCTFISGSYRRGWIRLVGWPQTGINFGKRLT